MKHVTLPALFLAMILAPGLLLAQQPGALETGYQLPPKAIVDILDAPPPPTAVISPAQNVMALLDRASMPKIADLAEPMLRLAGSRINPKTNGPHSPASILGITFKRIADGSRDEGRAAAQRPDRRPGLLARREVDVVHGEPGQRRRALDGGHGVGQGQGRDGGHHQRARGLRLARGQFGHALPFRRGRPRARSCASSRADGARASRRTSARPHRPRRSRTC